VTAHLMKYLYSFPGMEDVEDVIVSSGPNTWPNWRNFSDRIIQPGDIVFMDLAALTWNGYKSCYYRTYCVGKEPSKEQKDTYATALEWLYDSIHAVKAGTTTREIAKKWPSAKEAWGYKEEDQAAANLWGHGLGLAQYDPPVISRIWSLDHPIEIKAGMTFALETQHGKRFRYGDADRARKGNRDHLQLPGQTDHGGRSDPRLRRSREMSNVSLCSPRRCERGRCRAAAPCPRQPLWRSPPPRHLRGSADRTWCRAGCPP
jgi:Xaa-Pro aminopeptidase